MRLELYRRFLKINFLLRSMKKLLNLVPGSTEYHSRKVDTRLPGFEAASDLELARNSLCWLGDLGRYKHNVWTEIRGRLDSSKVSDIFLKVSVIGYKKYM